MFKGLEPKPDYVLKNPVEREASPLMFSIRAHKPTDDRRAPPGASTAS